MEKEKLTFWKVVEKISLIVTIVGLSSIALQMCNFRKELKEKELKEIENKANEKIIEAVAIFNSAGDTLDYQNAFCIFLKIRELKPNDTTGYSMFLGLAKRINNNIKEHNNGINKYDREVEKYLQYADSLNGKPNEARNLLTDIQYLKSNEN